MADLTLTVVVEDDAVRESARSRYLNTRIAVVLAS